ncbi:MAG TPA: 3'-5' exonuclease [Paludibacter sp.]|jgi:ribonuclease D|nr:MAG: ribonuclease D [Bacteroidetes bacterium ADurb.Bin174]HQB28355.1 3'-5' exonuclease [Paludibacter sp.]
MTYINKGTISKEEVNKLPLVFFEGEIIIVDTEKKAKKAIKILRKQKIVGIDTETKPSFRKGQINKVALLQITTADQCFLFRLNKIDFPKSLAKFLSRKSTRKIGLALRDDFIGLNKHYNFKPENIIDLQKIVNDYGILEQGLQKIFAIVFNQKISKSQRLSNWESEELTEHQQLYAATDAWAALMIYNQLMKREKLSKEEIEGLKQQNNGNNNS